LSFVRVVFTAVISRDGHVVPLGVTNAHAGGPHSSRAQPSIRGARVGANDRPRSQHALSLDGIELMLPLRFYSARAAVQSASECQNAHDGGPQRGAWRPQIRRLGI
jgi:hypothetical protein